MRSEWIELSLRKENDFHKIMVNIGVSVEPWY